MGHVRQRTDRTINFTESEIGRASQISIVIPLYNKQATIQRAIRSVIAQGIPEIQIIVVDDGSTDGSAEEVKAITDERIYLIQQAECRTGACQERRCISSDG